jgi:aspartyl-tRNA(Asn)/glutamyl-tRNA(Gln) amidotransferase subunit A
MPVESQSAEAAVEVALTAIERHNDQLGAMITPTPDEARAAAEAADRAAAEGRWLGLLHGLTMAVKDNIQTAAVRTTSGSLHFKDVVPNQDAFVVSRLKAAGAVLVGKATMHELAFGVRSDNPVSGQCRNPWDPSRVPGGSSGGSGAAVAAGMAAAALGSDTGGSVKLPAAMCGVAGLRPTHGRVSNHGATPVSPSFDTIGPLARRVADLARILAVIAGKDTADPYTGGPDLGNFLPSLGDGIEGLRIGLPRNHYFEDLDADVGAAVEAAVRTFEKLGAELVDIDVPGAEATHGHATTMVFADACAFHDERLQNQPELFSKQVYERMSVGRSFSALDYARAQRAREDWRRSLAQVFDAVDVMLSPTTPAPPPPLVDERTLLEATRDASRNTYAGGFGGIPGLSLPCGFTGDGLPVGVQLEAVWWQEPLLLRAGTAFEGATEWHLARPPLAAAGT